MVKPLQPVQTNPRPIYQRQPSNKNGSVIDIFDVSRSDDPFDVAQLNSLDEKEILAQVFLPPNNNNTPESTGNSISDPLWVKKIDSRNEKVETAQATTAKCSQFPSKCISPATSSTSN